MSNSAFNSDPVSVPLRRLSIGCNPNPEIKISSFLILHSPRYQQEEQVFIKTNTLWSPPPVLMILQKRKRIKGWSRKFFTFTLIVSGHEASFLDHLWQYMVNTSIKYCKSTCKEWRYVEVEIEEENEQLFAISLWWMKSSDQLWTLVKWATTFKIGTFNKNFLNASTYRIKFRKK